MSEKTPHRRPATFKLDDPGVIVMDPEDSSRPSRGTVHVTPEVEAAALPVPIETPVLRPQRGFRWGAVFWSATGGLILLGLGLGVARLIEDLFARSEGLGFVGLAFAFAATLAFTVVVAREAFGLARLAAIEKLHLRAAAVLASDDRAESRAIVRELLRLEHQNPQLARARATLQGHTDDIIDGADLIRLAERELMTPLDQEARRLVSSAAQRVSLVTAVSPRALIDVLFVFAASLRLIRQLARLYGGRPGALGMIATSYAKAAEPGIVEGVDAIEQRDGLARLVPLQVSHEVPAHAGAAQLAQRADLRLGLLNLVLPEVAEARREALANGLGAEGLAHDKQRDAFHGAPGAGTSSSRPVTRPHTRLSWSGWESARKTLIATGQSFEQSVANPHGRGGVHGAATPLWL
jgi:putative membrane protein